MPNTRLGPSFDDFIARMVIFRDMSRSSKNYFWRFQVWESMMLSSISSIGQDVAEKTRSVRHDLGKHCCRVTHCVKEGIFEAMRQEDLA